MDAKETGGEVEAKVSAAGREHGLLFKPEMNLAIREGRKWMTRRILKPQPTWIESSSRWCWPIPKSAQRPGCATDAVTASREWPQYLPDGCFKYLIGDSIYVKESVCFTVDDCSFSGDPEATVKGAFQMHGVEQAEAKGWAIYRVTDPHPDLDSDEPVWESPLFMPRFAARTVRPITGVRIERLQDITQEDARAEGIACLTKDDGRTFKYGIPESDGLPGPTGWQWRDWQLSAKQAYARLWDLINAKPKPVYGTALYKDGKLTRAISHYESFPWDGESRTETHRGKPHHITPNPWVIVVEFERTARSQEPGLNRDGKQPLPATEEPK